MSLALWLSPAAAHAQDGRPVAWPPKNWEQIRQADCEAELALRAETGLDMSGLSRAIELAFVALSPHVGMTARVDGSLHPLVLMPLSLPVGPASPTRTRRSFLGCLRESEAFRPFRLSLEPGLSLGKSTTGFLRGSFRAILHPANSSIGVGAGFGALADWQDERAFGFSSELLFQFGACCAPPFWQLSVRRDQYPSDRNREALVLVFGPTIW